MPFFNRHGLLVVLLMTSVSTAGAQTLDVRADPGQVKAWIDGRMSVG